MDVDIDVTIEVRKKRSRYSRVIRTGDNVPTGFSPYSRGLVINEAQARGILRLHREAALRGSGPIVTFACINGNRNTQPTVHAVDEETMREMLALEE